MKRATTITLLCMGVGAAFVANAYERRCDADQDVQPTPVTALSAGAPTPTSPPRAPTSCRSSSGYSHTYYHSSSGGGGYGFVSSGISRGGFGGSGHSSGS